MQTSEEKYQYLIDNMNEGVFISDEKGIILFANNALVRIHGFDSQDKLLNKNFIEFLEPSAREKTLKDFENEMRSGKAPNEIEMPIVRPDGSIIHVLVRPFFIRDGQGITSMSGIVRDITERKFAEEAMRKSEEKYRGIFENIQDVYYELSIDGTILEVSPSIETISKGQYQRKDLLGKSMYDIYADAGERKSFLSLLKQYGSVMDFEVTLKNRDGSLIPCSLSSKMWLNNQGAPEKIVGSMRDISKRKRIEEALLIMHEELAQTNIELQKANLVKSRFLANMSHEIRTPLNAIIGMAELLMNTELNREQRDFAETVLNSSEVLISIINDILDFSKIEAEKMEMEKRPFEIYRCVEGALDLVTSKAMEKKLELVYSVDENVPSMVIGDLTRVRQILVNLLSNAVKFTEHGEVVVKVIGQLHDHDKYQLHFIVKDTGIGIPLDSQNRLFQSFSQIDASTTRKYGGTGLGLAISKRLCELMGGSMWVESTGIAGEGSAFHFTVLAGRSIEEKAVMNLANLLDKNILIVDDNKTNREILIHQTRSWSMHPTAVASGAEALELLNKGKAFDLAILDMQMPEMDGLVLADEIRKLQLEKTIPLVLLSSLGFRENQNERPRFAASLTKPVKPSHLYNALSTALSRKVTMVKKHRVTSRQFDSEIGRSHPLRILLAEDNEINQKVALRFLAKIGYRADVAFNGLKVLEALKVQLYDVILMDVQMPEMDGEQTTHEIRTRWPVDQQPRIIAMTANAMQGDREHYLSIGMDDYLAKPVRIKDLVRALMESQPRALQPDRPTAKPL
jgi:PAS domain S-box-containing protein